MTHRCAAFSLALALVAGPVAARAFGAAPPNGDSRESGRLYQTGLDSYARGDLRAAREAFRKGLRLEPNNHAALAAVLRLEWEIAAQPPPVRPAPEESARRPVSARLDHFLLVSVPRWFYFERTIGDGLRDVGTLNALNARVAQLLGERDLALARNRPFRKDRQLRELLRRAPVAARGQEET